MRLVIYREKKVFVKKGRINIKLDNISEKKAKVGIATIASVFVVVVVAVIIYILNYREPYEVLTYSMGSYVQQTIYGADSSKAASLGANAVDELEELISWKIEGSDIANINDKAGVEWTTVSESTYNILKKSLDVSQKSGGAFDITIAPLSRLWNFDESPTEPPPASLIESLLPNIDYSALRVNDEEMSFSFKSEAYAIDLGSVGKGAACEAVLDAYKALSVDYAIVSVGGSIGTYGSKPFGAKWSIAVRNPEDETALGIIEITDGFISTSGNYEKTFEYDGEVYHHILSPKTGYPVNNELSSVTVVCNSGIISDALSTACFVLGYEESLSILSQYNAEAVFIFNNKEVKVTDGLKDSFTLNNGDYSLG